MQGACLSHRVVGFLLLCAVISSGLIACKTLERQKCNSENLGQSVEKFLMALRWEEYKVASQFIPLPSRRQFWDDMDLFQRRVRLMDFEVRDVSLRQSTMSADVILQCRFYHTDDPQLHTRTIQREWRYMNNEKVWLIVKHDLESLILAGLHR